MKLPDKIRDKEIELGITNSYKGWDNRMYKFFFDEGIDPSDALFAIIERDFKKRTPIYAYTTEELIQGIKDLDSNSIVLFMPQNTVVYRGDGADEHFCNDEYCKENGIEIVNVGYSGGTIVSLKGDLGIVVKLDDSQQCDFFLKKCSMFFDNSYVNNNDIMIDYNKICGSAFSFERTALQCSFSVDIDLIKNICNKRMDKKPAGITELTGKTLDEFMEYLKTWLVLEDNK